MSPPNGERAIAKRSKSKHQMKPPTNVQKSSSKKRLPNGKKNRYRKKGKKLKGSVDHSAKPTEVQGNEDLQSNKVQNPDESVVNTSEPAPEPRKPLLSVTPDASSAGADNSAQDHREPLKPSSPTPDTSSSAFRSSVQDQPQRRQPLLSFIKPAADPRESRTMFLGNIPVGVKRQAIKRLAGSYGRVENVRIRGVVPESPGLPKRAALLSNRMHPKLASHTAYVVFAEEKSVASAVAALNMTRFVGNLIRATPANATELNPRHSIFVGNLPLDVNEQEFIDAFTAATPGYRITGARVVRDKMTGMCRGFGFITFEDELGARFASLLEDVRVGGRLTRITLADKQGSESDKKAKASNAEAAQKRVSKKSLENGVKKMRFRNRKSKK